MAELRPYQRDAVNAIYQYARDYPDQNPLVVLPTGSGKTHVILRLIVDTIQSTKSSVLVLTHQKELLEQAANKLISLRDNIDYGYHCSGISKDKDVKSRVIFASIQSVVNNASLICTDEHRIGLVIIDEAHRINIKSESQYKKFITDLKNINPDVCFVGLTATPYRLSGGYIYGDSQDLLFRTVCYNADVKELIDAGYLTQLIYYSGSRDCVPDSSRYHMRAGEFITSEVESNYVIEGLVRQTCWDFVAKTVDRSHVLIFTCSIRHATMIRDILIEQDINPEDIYVVHSKMEEERDEVLKKFVSDEPKTDMFGEEHKRRTKYLINVDILTTGYDAPCIDGIVILRATASMSLYVQMVGRGMRLYDGKENCLVLDYGDNVVRFGPITDLRELDCTMFDDNCGTERGEYKPRIVTCKKCGHIGDNEFTWKCSNCGELYESENLRRLKSFSYSSEEVKQREYEPTDVYYTVHTKEKDDGSLSKSMVIHYVISEDREWKQYVCIENKHPFVKRKFSQWWQLHYQPDLMIQDEYTADLNFDNRQPTAKEAVLVGNSKGLLVPNKIRVWKDPISGFWSIDEAGDLVPCNQLAQTFDEDEVPF